MIKKYNQAPLPFQGQKRKWKKVYQKALLEHFSDKTVFVDLFGGSGLLSHFTKEVLPNAIVIYNDYDNYTERLADVEHTNAMLHELRNILANYPHHKKIAEPERTQILQLIERESRKGFVDYITLSSSLMFSMHYATTLEKFKKETLYNSVRMSDYITEGYLLDVEVVREDYKRLFERWNGVEDVVFLIDPPYLSTNAGTYSQDYWKLKDYLDVLHTLKNTNYFYFTSNKSNVVELCDWLENNYAAQNPFAGASKLELNTTITPTAQYTDIMLFKRHLK